MANDDCLNYNCDEIIDHAPVDCGEFVNGGLKDIILLECGHNITDPSNATQVNAAIAAGTAKVIKQISAELPARSAQKADSPVACQPQRIINYDNTLTFTDANVTSNNIEFYSTVFGGHTFAGAIINECDADKVSWVDENIVFEGALIKPKSNNEVQRFEGTGTWRTKRLPTWHNVPAGIF